ncbi:MAG: hypothetical protein RL754_523 [Bacteroidota bacterium]
MNRNLILALFTVASIGLQAQTIVRPAMENPRDRFSTRPELVIKANPLTLLFGSIDAGVEYRSKNDGWVLMNHSYFGQPINNGQSFVEPYYEQTNMYVRMSAERRFYREKVKSNGRIIEKYRGIYAIMGYSSISSTYDVQSVDFGYLPTDPNNLADAGRIDFMMGVDLGRSRDLGTIDSPWYWETSWKLGYNFTSQSPQLLYGIRMNFIPTRQ